MNQVELKIDQTYISHGGDLLRLKEIDETGAGFEPIDDEVGCFKVNKSDGLIWFEGKMIKERFVYDTPENRAEMLTFIKGEISVEKSSVEGTIDVGKGDFLLQIIKPDGSKGLVCTLAHSNQCKKTAVLFANSREIYGFMKLILDLDEKTLTVDDLKEYAKKLIEKISTETKNINSKKY